MTDLFRFCPFCNEHRATTRFRGSRVRCRECEAERKRSPECKARSKAYTDHKRLTDPEFVKRNLTWSKSYRNKPASRANQIFLAARTRSRMENLEFNLDAAFILEKVLKGLCERSGLPFVHTSDENKRYNPFTPSLDKINAFGGYTKDNVQIVVWCYNAGKNQMTDEEFISFCHAVARNNPQ